MIPLRSCYVFHLKVGCFLGLLSLLCSLWAEPLTPSSLQTLPDKIVVLTFDDSVKSHFTVARPLLKKHGFNATFFITEGFDFTTNKTDYMSWEEIRQLHDDGFEIGNHTRSHLGIGASNLAQIRDELEHINRLCQIHGIPKPISFAYPGNAFHVGALPILKELGILWARRGGAPEVPYETGGGYAYEPYLDHPLLIPTAGDARPTWALLDLQKALQRSLPGSIPVLQFHGVPDLQHPWVNTPSDRFEEYLQFLDDEGYEVIALRDLARFVDPTITPDSPESIIQLRQDRQRAPSTHLTPDELNILPLNSQPREMMARYWESRLAQKFEEWDTRYETLKSSEEIDSYQQRQRHFFLETLGGFPEKSPLRARTTRSLVKNRIPVELVLFESQPGFHVTAALFLPDPQEFAAPYPGVIVACGHSANGKGLDLYQKAAFLLAKNGIAALLVDPIDQGERYQWLEADGKPAVTQSTTGHSYVGLGAMLLGWNTARYEIWDLIRSIDYLQSRPDIRADKIGVTGNSGGGTQTAYLMALDQRISAAAPSCYITSLEQLLKTIGPQDAEQVLHNQIGFGLDHADYLLIPAPLPILLCTATRDFFDISGSWNTFRKAKRLYSRLGFAERVDLIEVDQGHGFHQPLREAVARWMTRWLDQRDEPIVEPPLEALTAEEIQVTPQGQVLLLPGSVSAYDLNQRQAQHLEQGRSEIWKDPANGVSRLRKRTQIPALHNLPIPSATLVSTKTEAHWQWRRWILRPEPGIELPLLECLPQPQALLQASSHHPLLLVTPKLDPEWLEGDEILHRARLSGRAVYIASPRGTGQTQATHRPWYREVFGADGRDLVTAYLLGTSYVSERTRDILSLTRWIQTLHASPIHLVGRSTLSIPALHAAALEAQAYTRVEISECENTWKNLLHRPDIADQLQHIQPGALNDYDLSDLIHLVKNRLHITPSFQPDPDSLKP